jgi:hypothetical protein
LELVDESNETGVVDVDASVCTDQKVFVNGSWYLLNPTYADAFVAMFGEEQRVCLLRDCRVTG